MAQVGLLILSIIKRQSTIRSDASPDTAFPVQTISTYTTVLNIILRAACGEAQESEDSIVGNTIGI